MTPPSWPVVPAEVEHWVADVCVTGRRLTKDGTPERPLPEELARLHNEFEQVHPFIDGNGRVASC